MINIIVSIRPETCVAVHELKEKRHVSEPKRDILEKDKNFRRGRPEKFYVVKKVGLNSS